jgi:hypothetical protein
VPNSGNQKLSHGELEARRELLLKRLERLGNNAKAKQGYASVRALLGTTYRRANLTARLAVLETAHFMVSVLEKLPPL